MTVDFIACTDDHIDNVRQIVSNRMKRQAAACGTVFDGQQSPGKMLRSRFAARLLGPGGAICDSETVAYACAAVELAHTASLLHDDVIDGGLIRRGRPTLWRVATPTAAVLAGDVLLCEAIRLLLQVEEAGYADAFVQKVHEMCSAEIRHELVLGGVRLNALGCLRIARSKTGALFAFVGMVCGGHDAVLSDALEEAGYRIGAAYQIADDLLDLVGEEEAVGKTLGTDEARGKYTLPQHPGDGRASAAKMICEQCEAALGGIAPWPSVRDAVEAFLLYDVQPVFEPHFTRAGIEARFTV